MKAKKSTKKTKGAANRERKDLTTKTSVVGGDATTVKIMTVQHDTQKSIVQNLRA